MIGKNTGAKTPVTLAETLEILEERSKDGELGYEQKLAHDHVKKFALVSKEEAKKLRQELQEFGLSPAVAVKIIDIMPIDKMQLKQILAKERKTFEDDEVVKIFEIVEKKRGK